MDNGARKISPALFALIIICFLLPFVSISCGGQEIAKLSGIQMVTGTTIQGEEMPPNALAIITLAIAAIGLGVGFWKSYYSAIPSFLAGVVGFITTLMLKSGLDEEIISQGGSTEWGAGYYLTLILFLAAAGFNTYLMVRNKSLPLPQGNTRSVPRFCTQCGARNDEGNDFCTQCGFRLAPGGYGRASESPISFSPGPPQTGENYVAGEDDATSLLREPDETSLLEEVPSWPVLKVERAGGEEIIPIDKPEFFIGRNREAVDYCETGNQNIGRVHAKIIRQNGVCYIVDLESKNGTYLNGERLPSNEPYPLNFKDKIRLANVEYTFDEA